MNRLSYRYTPALLAALAGVAACGENLTLPDSSGVGLDLTIVRGDQQTGPVGEALAEPLVVRVMTDGGRPVAGREVAFVLESGQTGELDPDTAVTNSSGEALARWVLGTDIGEYGVEARLVTEAAEGPAAQFAASAVAAAPDTLRAESPLLQPGRRGETLQDPLVVIVVDRFGNPAPGIAVEWQVTAGEGDVSEDATTTGADGTASVQWTLGGRIGVQKVTATVEGISGSPLTFSATVLF